MGKEPVKTEQKNKTGRPSIAEEQYYTWLQELRPHLELAMTLLGACRKAGLEDKYNSCILAKYNLNDWFSSKVDAYRQSFGESINEALAKETMRILDKAKRTEPLNRDEINVLQHQSEHHRAAAPFFHNRQENVNIDATDVGKILDTIEASNYENVGQKAQGQMVAPNESVQDQGQTGTDNNIPAESPAVNVPSPEGNPPVQ